LETIGIRQARRLALARAGLLKPEWTGLPTRAAGRGARARKAARAVIRRFGYLQLDTVAVAGARSHAIVLLSRLAGFDPDLAEALLQPGEPLFEYWGHEASWLPIESYPVFAFRRRAFRRHPWWGDLIGQHPQVADDLRRRVRDEGPLRSLDMDGRGGRGWWDLKLAKQMATALWSSGEFAIRERRNFQRTFDLAERVIPARWREAALPQTQAIEKLLLQGLKGHGWATTATLTQTWRLQNLKAEIAAALGRLAGAGQVVACALVTADGRRRPGWLRVSDFELTARLERVRPRRDRGVLLSPFDPVLWDRRRVRYLFDFDQVLEIFKPEARRVYGYYCLPVLAGERLVARMDLKAERRAGRLHVLAVHFEVGRGRRAVPATDRRSAQTALARYAAALALKPVGDRALNSMEA
jgi:uncharacterized protein YcaQ